MARVSVDKEFQVIRQYWSQTFLLPLLEKKSLNVDPLEKAFKNNGGFFFFGGGGLWFLLFLFFVSAQHCECPPESSFIHVWEIRIELNN